MAKDIKLFKDGNEVIINELELDNFKKLGWKEQENKPKSNKDKNKWQHITEKKES
jgi:hypothetical protein